MNTENVLKLLAYLERNCAGEDRHEFWTTDGQPDIATARSFAEGLRAQLGGFLHDFVEVEQRVNMVKLRMLVGVHECEPVG